MNEKFIKLEESTAILQDEMSQVSLEVYAQQKEIVKLRLEVEALRARLENAHPDSGILAQNEDTPPPHY
ncbi:SlyX family protein [Candidatus Puniceispirillum sp.]|nr:SlyX family protein [Candidatus Puniceispirillum sp.]